MSYLKNSLIFASKILLTMVLSFLALEFLLLVFNETVFRNSFFMYDYDMGFKVRPYTTWGAFKTNEFGFNDRDYPHERRPGTYRILILGDSFNWVGGQDGNYTAILERKFAAEFGDEQVEVINIGYPQTHTGEELVALKKYGLQYNPDLLVLGFFVGNDFFDAKRERKRIVVGSGLTDIDVSNGPEWTFMGQPLVLHSRLWLFLQEQWVTYKALRLAHAAPPTPTPMAQSVSMPTEDYLQLEVHRMQVTNWDYAARLQPNVDYIYEQLADMQQVLAARQIEFIVAAYPDEFQVDEALRQAIAKQYNIDYNQGYQLDRPQGLVWQFCTDHQIEFYDLLPTFQQAHQAGQQLYLPNDSHWNQDGNELAAQYLFDKLIWKVRKHYDKQSN